MTVISAWRKSNPCKSEFLSYFRSQILLPVLDALLLDGGLPPRPADDLPRCGEGQPQHEGVQGRFGLVFGLKMCGFVYFDSTMYNEPYYALRNVIARSVTSLLQFGKTKLTCHVMEVHKDYL